MFKPEADCVVVESFGARLQEYHKETANEIITERFNAGLQMFHVPAGEAEAFNSFSVVPSGFDVLGKPMPEHETVTTDILRNKANG